LGQLVPASLVAPSLRDSEHIIEFRFPTLKRGADKVAAATASGAFVRTFLMQSSIAAAKIANN
jgi:hypothetical protein